MGEYGGESVGGEKEMVRGGQHDQSTLYECMNRS
jgi:hypothetical protein